jgi:hypothetical protein
MMKRRHIDNQRPPWPPWPPLQLLLKISLEKLAASQVVRILIEMRGSLVTAMQKVLTSMPVCLYARTSTCV